MVIRLNLPFGDAGGRLELEWCVPDNMPREAPDVLVEKMVRDVSALGERLLEQFVDEFRFSALEVQRDG